MSYLLIINIIGSLQFDPAELCGPMHLYKEWLFVKTPIKDELLLRDQVTPHIHLENV